MTTKPQGFSAKVSASENIIDAEFWGAAGPGGTLPAAGPVEIAFAGRSNVGKSSLLNKLVDRRGLVRKGGTPGTTRQVNLFKIKLADGLELGLADLPGYGYAKRSRAELKSWQELIERYLSRRPTLRAVVVLVDARRGFEHEEEELLEFVQACEHPSGSTPDLIWVATKLDKLTMSERKPAIAKLRSAPLMTRFKGRVIGFSAVTGEGRDDLWRAIRAALRTASPLISPDDVVTSQDETPAAE